MSSTTSGYGSSSGRASVPGTARPSGRAPAGRAPSGRAGAPAGGYRDRERADWPPRSPARRGPGGSGPGGPPPGRPERPPYRGRPRPRWGRIALVAGVLVLIVGLVAGISLYGYTNGLDKDLKRTDAF